MENAIIFEWDDILYPVSLMGHFSAQDFENLDIKLDIIFKTCLDSSDIYIVNRDEKWIEKSLGWCLPKSRKYLLKIHTAVPTPWHQLTVSDFRNSMKDSKKKMFKDILRSKDYRSVSYITDQLNDVDIFDMAVTEAIFSVPTFTKTVTLSQFPSIEQFFLNIRLLSKKSFYISRCDRNLKLKNVRDLIRLECPSFQRASIGHPIDKKNTTRFTEIIPFSNITNRFSRNSHRAGSMPLLSHKKYSIPEEDTMSNVSQSDDEVEFEIEDGSLRAFHLGKIFKMRKQIVKPTKIIIELSC